MVVGAPVAEVVVTTMSSCRVGGGELPDASVTTRAATNRTKDSSTTARRRRIWVWRRRRLACAERDVGSLTTPGPGQRPESAIRLAHP